MNSDLYSIFDNYFQIISSITNNFSDSWLEATNGLSVKENNEVIENKYLELFHLFLLFKDHYTYAMLNMFKDNIKEFIEQIFEAFKIKDEWKEDKRY